jgi:hypothetical protein
MARTIIHIRSGAAGTPALCGQPLPGPQLGAYQPAEAHVCKRCLGTRFWQRHLAWVAAGSTPRYTLTPAGADYLAEQE